jgi:hypothetical protein
MEKNIPPTEMLLQVEDAWRTAITEFLEPIK